MANNFYNNSDSVDISELAALNEDISDDLIDQLQQQLTQNMPDVMQKNKTVNVNDDSTLFEEQVPQETVKQDNNVNIKEDVSPSNASMSDTDKEKTAKNETSIQKEKLEVNQTFDDNFIKKYKAKLQKKAMETGTQTSKPADSVPNKKNKEEPTTSNMPIETLSQGNITEKPLTAEQKEYNDSLDFLDGNVKYSKYVIYIDPQNVDFIDSLTVKERKNLINGILRQQDDITITKKRFKVVQTVINQIVVAILTIAISVPIIYYAINASLEATINNHRNAETNWQILYKDHGKIMRH